MKHDVNDVMNLLRAEYSKCPTHNISIRSKNINGEESFGVDVYYSDKEGGNQKHYEFNSIDDAYSFFAGRFAKGANKMEGEELKEAIKSRVKENKPFEEKKQPSEKISMKINSYEPGRDFSNQKKDVVLNVNVKIPAQVTNDGAYILAETEGLENSFHDLISNLHFEEENAMDVFGREFTINRLYQNNNRIRRGGWWY